MKTKLFVFSILIACFGIHTSGKIKYEFDIEKIKCIKNQNLF